MDHKLIGDKMGARITVQMDSKSNSGHHWKIKKGNLDGT
jgi:hypothetical protein